LQNLEKGSYKIYRKGKAKLEQDTISKDKSWGENTEKNLAWEKPPDGFVKCNVDASFISEEKKGSWGAVLRDRDGRSHRMPRRFKNCNCKL
jgi:hypothetical protein